MSDIAETIIMAEAAFRPPSFKDTDNPSQAWRDYKEDLDMYILAAGLEEAGEERKVAMLLYGLTQKHRKIYQSFGLTTEQKKVYKTVVAKFDEHFEPKKVTKLYMKRFDSCTQSANESVADFIARLKELARQCDFGATLENQLCKQISVGVHDQVLREKLWGEDLTLKQIEEKCFHFEQRRESKNVLQGTDASVNYFSARGRNQFRGHGKSRGRGRGHGAYDRNPHDGESHRNPPARGTQQRGGQSQKTQSHPQMHSGWKCTFCGTSHRPRQCPAYGKACNHCHKIGHFSSVCRNKRTVYDVDYECEAVSQAAEPQQFDMNDQFVWCNTTSNDKSVEWSVNLTTDADGDISFKIDTAAQQSILSLQSYRNMSLNPPTLSKTNTNIFGLGKQLVKPVGTVVLDVMYKGNKYEIRCEVIDGNVPNLLSLSDSIKLDLVRRVNTNKQETKWPESVMKCEHESIKSLIEEYEDVFTGIGKVPGSVSLKIDKDVPPVVHPPRPIPVALRDAVKAKLDQLEQDDIIERIPIGTPTQWCSSLHVVPKKDNSVRLTIDPRDLNKALVREYHPTNTVEDVSQRVGHAKYFTVLDANQGYFQLELDEDSRNYTAFNTPFGRYRYLRLPMGINSAPELFQRVFGDIFADTEGLEIIMDDFLIASDTIEQHAKVLRQTLHTARENNVTFSRQKIQLCMDSVKYGGHKFTATGVELDKERIRSIPVADALSRAYLKETAPTMDVFTVSTEEICNVKQMSPPRMAEIKKETEKDAGLQEVIKVITSPEG